MICLETTEFWSQRWNMTSDGRYIRRGQWGLEMKDLHLSHGGARKTEEGIFKVEE